MTTTHGDRRWPTTGRPVTSFGTDRICTAVGCDTRLSRYNPDNCCFVHRDQVPRRPIDHGRRT